jgi:hypothetical protein
VVAAAGGSGRSAGLAAAATVGVGLGGVRQPAAGRKRRPAGRLRDHSANALQP